MVIRMQKTANRIMAEYIARTFQNRGFDVYIKNGDGKFIIAVLGQGNISVYEMAGILRIEKDDFFVAHRGEFITAETFFRD